MSFLSGLEISKDDLNADRLIFTGNTVVKFMIKDFKEDEDRGLLFLKTTVLSAEHEGKEHTIVISKASDHPMQKKNLAEFIFAFWSEDEVKSGDMNLSRLVGRHFQAKALKPNTTSEGKTYQSFSGYADLGIPGAMPQSDSQPASVATAAQATQF